MRNALLLFAFSIQLGLVRAQSINVAFYQPTSPFQDADVGAMAFADIDNDGDQDLLISGKGGPVKTTLYINDGSGNFSEATGSPLVQVFGGAVGFADLNEDGFVDLLVTGTTTGGTRTATLYTNNQNGTFSIKSAPFLPSNNGDFAFGDVDADGDEDLILTGSTGSQKVTLYLNDGSANFSEIPSTPFEQLNTTSIVLIDVENDGDKDVLLSGQFNTVPLPANQFSTKLYRNNGAGVFTVDTANAFPGVSGGDLAVADSDNDGDSDILINGNSSQGRITKLFVNNGLGVFSEAAGTTFVGTSGGKVEFADFNNDGKKDVILLGAKTGVPSATAQIYENQGDNSFVPAADLIATYLGSLAIADIDNDGDLDFIMGGTHFQLPTHSPKLYKNNFSPLATGDSKEAGSVVYYPNPTTGTVTFLLPEPIESIRLYDALGKVVLEEMRSGMEFSVDMGRFSTGSYFAHLRSGQKTQMVRLAKF